MHPVIAKTFGGLSLQYYFRQFLFGLIFPVLIYFMMSWSANANPVSLAVIGVMLINTVLYPYSRFVYEGIVGFVVGQNMFWVNALFLLFVKLMTMALCWGLAIFVAPVGLAYLYFQNGKANR